MSRLDPRRRLILWLLAVEAVIGLAMVQVLVTPFTGSRVAWCHHAHHHQHVAVELTSNE